MNIQIGDWLLDVNIPFTMSISAEQAKEHCMCGYCRNYYQAIDRVCPNLRKFLSQFGVDILAPDELSPFEPTVYEASYIVQGSILYHGNDHITIDGIPLQILSSEYADLETEHPMPYFVLRIGLIQLPWLLDEPMDEVISPANEPEYLDRMQKKLLEQLSNQELFS